MQFCGKAQKSLIRSQRSSATTCSLQKSEHTSTSRKNWVIRKQDLFYLLIPGNKQQKPYHSRIGTTFSKRTIIKTRVQPCATQLTSVLEIQEANIRNGALWNTATSGSGSWSHRTNSGYHQSALCFQTGANTARAHTYAHTKDVLLSVWHT